MTVKNEIILHQHVEVALNTLEDDLSLGSLFPEHFSVLLGPSDAGKTRLLEELQDRAEARGEKVLKFLAPAKSSHTFSWRPLQMSFLRALGYSLTKTRTERNLEDNWYIIYELIKQEAFDLIIIDDTDFLNTAVSESARSTVIEKIRTIVRNLPSNVVLAGTHHLQSIITVEGQGSNRCHPVCLDNYLRTEELHVEAFLDCVEIISSRLDVPLADEVFEDVDLLFDESLGCVGSIYERLHYAQAYAKRRNVAFIEREDFVKAYKEIDPMKKRKSEIEIYYSQKNKEETV